MDPLEPRPREQLPADQVPRSILDGPRELEREALHVGNARHPAILFRRHSRSPLGNGPSAVAHRIAPAAIQRVPLPTSGTSATAIEGSAARNRTTTVGARQGVVPPAQVLSGGWTRPDD